MLKFYGKTIMFALLIICLSGCMLLFACQKADVDNSEMSQNGMSSTPIKNVRYDHNFLSLDEAKALFAPGFNPLIPEFNLSYGDYEASDLCPANYLLSKEGNYYISLNNPLKEFRSEQAIYEAYTISIATPSILKDPSFYGVTDEELDSLTHKGVWFNKEFFLDFFGDSILEAGAEALELFSQHLNYYEKDNELTAYGIKDSPNNMVSYVTINAYTDIIKNDYENHQYPRNKKYTENSSYPKQNITINDVEVSLTLVEFLRTDSRDLILEIERSFSNLKKVEELGVIYTFCTADFKIDGINYSISYPLMNRLINVNSQDYASVNSTDYIAISNVATKSLSHFLSYMSIS